MEWVLAVYLGTAHTVSAPLTVDQTRGTSVTLSDIDYHGNSLTLPLYYGFRVAYFPRPDAAVGLEAEMIHLKVYAHTNRSADAAGVHRNETIAERVPVSRIIESFSISHGLNMVLFNAVVRRPLRLAGWRSRVQVSGRVGAGPTIPHPESTIDGVPYGRYELGALGIQAAAGLEVRLTTRVAIMAEYKLTRTAQAVSVDRGTATGTFVSHHAVVGLAWHSH